MRLEMSRDRRPSGPELSTVDGEGTGHGIALASVLDTLQLWNVSFSR